jgi:tetratricopeptide (TPR) repeat protein
MARVGFVKVALACLSVALGGTANAQVYQVGPGASKQPQAAGSRPPSQSLGWGSNIQNARLARAAQLALERGDHAQALDYARRAAQAAPNDPQIWFLLGYAARLNGDYSASIDAYRHGLRLNPSAVDGLSGLAQDDALMGRTSDAVTLLKQVIQASPDRRGDVLLLANLNMKSKDYTNALKWASEAERLRPDANAEVLLALCYQRLHKLDLAKRYLLMAQRRASGDVDVQRSLAGYYNEVGDYAGAIAALKAVPNPKPDVVAELAYTYQLDGKMGDSARLYAKAASAEPKDLDMQLAAAQAEVAAGSIGEADAFLNRSAKLDASYYRLHAIRGEIAQLQEHNQDAAREYMAALSALPAHPSEGALYGIQLHMDLVALYNILEEPDSAKRELQIAQGEIKAVNESETDRAKYLRLRSLIELNAGELDAALADVREALNIDKSDRTDLQLDGDVLMKLGHVEEAIAVYKQILAADPDNRFALISLGYASRAAGRDNDAEMYFRRLETADPSSYVPYLALGDLYTARGNYREAQTSYSKGYALAPDNAAIVAGGINAGVEAHDLSTAGVWMKRVSGDMKHQPDILREEERYLSFDGKYQESAEKGEEAIKVLPRDRDVVVYLGYDLLHLGQYDKLLQLTKEYLTILPREPDIPLLEGYVDKHEGHDAGALADFTETLRRDPSVVTAYVNRGYVLNDLDRPAAAATDFQSAISRDPNDGEAHLGLAYADLDLNQPEAALRQATFAERTQGDSRDIHVIRATAYAREDMLAKAVVEYRAALKFTPNDSSLHFGLGSTLFSERQFQAAVDELQTAERLSPGNPNSDALLARAYANLQNRAETLRHVRLAEEEVRPGSSKTSEAPGELSDVLISTGEALSTIGDQGAAMNRFQRALEAPHSDRVSVRLAIAQLMAQKGQSQEAERQIALAWMEAEAGDTSPPRGAQYIAAADVFRSLHDYELSQTYLSRGKAAGAPDEEVRIGMADNDLALGETANAQAELSAITPAGGSPDYQLLIAEANVFRQEHEGAKALTAFAQASNAAGDDQAAVQDMLQAGADEGLRVTPALSVLSDFSIAPIFEDTTVYVLDSKLDSATPVPASDIALLPPPRSSIQSQWTDAFHLHLGNLPTASGFYQLRNARGLISVPSTGSVVDRDTTDNTFNFGLNPTVHLGNNILTFNSGIQGTIRRDSRDPVDMNQNLFRVFTYMSTSSFFNEVSASGYVIRETGPFTDSNLHSRTLSAAVDFRVGTPWGKTALVTGWGVNDQVFSPAHIENYYTSSYVGLERRFSDRWNVRAMVEDLRAWRVFITRGGIAQDLRPAASVDFAPKHNWDFQFSSAYSSTRGFHVYDAIQNGFSISYSRPFHRLLREPGGTVPVQYPIRFSAGWQQETFFNFSGPQSEQFRPYVQISIF